MKTLLTITVLVSSLLSIFSSSLKLYEVPVVKEVVSVVNNEKSLEEKNSDLNRVYISHDVSLNEQHKQSPILAAKKKQDRDQSSEYYINVFGVKVPNKNS